MRSTRLHAEGAMKRAKTGLLQRPASTCLATSPADTINNRVPNNCIHDREKRAALDRCGTQPWGRKDPARRSREKLARAQLPVDRLTGPYRTDPANEGWHLGPDELSARSLARGRCQSFSSTCASDVHAVLALPRSRTSAPMTATAIETTSASRIIRARSTACRSSRA